MEIFGHSTKGVVKPGSSLLLGLIAFTANVA